MSIGVQGIDAALQQMPEPSGWFSAGEAVRFASLGSGVRRESFLAGRWLARCLLGQVSGLNPLSLRMEIDAQGRSSVVSHAAVHLSISHTGDWVACALADAPIGIDMEQALRPRGDVLALAAMVHSPAQCEELAALESEPQLRCFYQLWTLKEASLKQEGRGLDFARMRAMEFEPVDEVNSADALSLGHAEQGLILAVAGGPFADTPALPAGVSLLQRWRNGDQSTPTSK